MSPYERPADTEEAGGREALEREFQAALDGLAQSMGDTAAILRAADALEAWFEYCGDFAALDGSIGLRRLATGTSGRSWRLRNDHYRLVETHPGEDRWTIHHPDGRRSYLLEKPWGTWDGLHWPLGHTVVTPDGETVTLPEGRFGDRWEVL